MSDSTIDVSEFDIEIDKEMTKSPKGRKVKYMGKETYQCSDDSLFDMKREKGQKNYFDQARKSDYNKYDMLDFEEDAKRDKFEACNKPQYERKEMQYNNDDFEIDNIDYNDLLTNIRKNKDEVKQNINKNTRHKEKEVAKEDSFHLSIDGEESNDFKILDSKPMKQDDSIISDVSLDIVNENIMKIFEYLDGDRKNEEKLLKRLKTFEERLDKYLHRK